MFIPSANSNGFAFSAYLKRDCFLPLQATSLLTWAVVTASRLIALLLLPITSKLESYTEPRAAISELSWIVVLLLECFPLFPSAWKTSLRPRLQRSVWYGAHFTHWLPSWEPSFGAHPSPRSWCLPPPCLVCLLPSTSLVGLLLSTHRSLGMTCQQRPFLTLELRQHIFTPIVSFFMCIKDLLIFT